MTHRRAFFIVGLLAAAAATPLVAEATDGLTLILFVTPPDAGASETLSIDVECYWWGTPVDVDDVRITMSPYGASPPFANVSTGKYHASYALLQGDIDGGTITIQASAMYRNVRAVDTSYYAPRGAYSGSGWSVHLRQVSPQNLAPPPGSHVVLEARSYDGYHLKEGGVINATLSSSDGANRSPVEILPATRLLAGVYRFEFDIPANLSASRQYEVRASLGIANYGASDNLGMWSNPIPVTVYVAGGNASALTLRIIAGTSSPIQGAQVELSQARGYFPYPAPGAPEVRNTTNANGTADLVVIRNESYGGYSTYTLNVTKSNRTTSLPVYLSFDTFTAWRPQPPFNYSCEARLQTDPTRFGPGDRAELSIRVTFQGRAEVRREISRFVWRAWYPGTVAAGNVTTDGNGVFTLNYTLPTNWTSGDWLEVAVECPEGQAARTSVAFGGFGTPYSGRDLVLNASGALGRDLTLNVTYTGARPIAGATAIALLIPGANVAGLVTQQPPDCLYVPLTLQGSTFTGSVAVPAWLPEGDYLIIVQVSNEAAISDAADGVEEVGFAAVSLFPPPPDPPAPPAPPPSVPGYSNGQSSGLSAPLGAISLSLGALWFLSKRRRRIADARAQAPSPRR